MRPNMGSANAVFFIKKHTVKPGSIWSQVGRKQLFFKVKVIPGPLGELDVAVEWQISCPHHVIMLYAYLQGQAQN